MIRLDRHAPCKPRYRLAFLVVLGPALMLCGCYPRVRPPVTAPEALVRISPREFPDFSDDMSYTSLLTAVDRSIEYLMRLDDSAIFRFGPDTYTASHMVKSMRVFQGLIEQCPSADDLARAIEESFLVYATAGNDGRNGMLFTGYYEPILRGSLQPSPGYPYPIYSRPDDWVSINLGLFRPEYSGERIVGRHVGQDIVPYFSRQEIDSDGRLREKGCEIVWVSDQFELFSLHIQGSGRVLLEDGVEMCVTYDGSNGRPYRSIGRLLIDEGRVPVDEVSMQRLRSYVTENPWDAERVFNHNESYVFFRVVDEGPIGAIGVVLTPMRSVATDLRLFPRGALGFMRTELPVLAEDGSIEAWRTVGRFVVNQDTGGVIRGPSRADLFCGRGRYAEIAAGHMQHPGELYFFVLNRNSER